MPDRALIITDMLNDFVHPDGALYIGDQSREIIEPIQKRLKAARSGDDIVLYVCDRHRPNDDEFEEWPAHAVEGTWGAEVIDELAPQDNEWIIRKRRYSGFGGTDLEITLHENWVQNLTIVGCLTNVCVLYTTADARMLDYNVTVPKNCVVSNDEKAHEFALREMEKTLGADVV